MDEDEVMLSCSNCTSEVSTEDAIYDSNLSDTLYCNDCYRICEKCDDIGCTDELWNFVDDSEYWCESCAERWASWCDYCETYNTLNGIYVSDRSANYCENCMENATYCDVCDEYNQDGCECENDSNMIHDYSYRPDPVFHSTTNDDRLYFGIEIEVENGRNGYDNKIQAAAYAQETLEPIELAYLKSDGSLSDGFEIVTHPMTHDFYQNQATELWDTLERLRTGYNMKSWSTSTCGLHIHISRTGFKGGAHMHRFLNLVYNNEEFYSLMAGRSSDRWAKFDDVDMSEVREREDGSYYRTPTYRSFKQKINDGRHTDRYSAVNTQNLHTLEMRIFKGTLKSSRVKALISLAHASVEYTRTLTVQDVVAGALNSESLMTYIDENASMYPDLVALLNVLVTERNLVTI